jgi:hypothetical protein
MIRGFFDIDRVDPVQAAKLLRQGWVPVIGDPHRVVMETGWGKMRTQIQMIVRPIWWLVGRPDWRIMR